MKRLIVLFGCVFLLLGGGCQEPGRNKNAVEVIIEGDGEFPPSLVGKWKANGGFWQFVFEPNGAISSAVINLGAVEMTPGKVSRFPTLYGGKGVFEPGQWLVQYSPDSRELSVEVVLKHFYQDIGAAAIEGSITDILVGPVSENGELWNADWFTFGRLVGYIPEPNEFYNTDEPEFRGSLTFEKVKQ
jgi:hypothetical protein